MAWAPGAVLPNCSSTTGVTPLSRACRLYPSRCPYALHLFIFFSEKLFGHIEVYINSVDLYVQPELGALQFNDVHISSVDGSDCLPGKFGYKVSDAVMPPSVKAFGAACGMPPIGIRNMGATLAPREGAAVGLGPV